MKRLKFTFSLKKENNVIFKIKRCFELLLGVIVKLKFVRRRHADNSSPAIAITFVRVTTAFTTKEVG